TDHRGGDDLQPERRAPGLDQEHGGIDADAEERVGAEIDVAGIAAEDGSGDRQHYELQDHVARVCNDLAWLLATVPDATLRDGKKALTLSTKACELTHWKAPQYLDT